MTAYSQAERLHFNHLQAAGCLFSVPYADLKESMKSEFLTTEGFQRFDGLEVVLAPYQAIECHNEAIFHSFNPNEQQAVLSELFSSESNYFLMYAPNFKAYDPEGFIDIQPITRLFPWDVHANVDFAHYLQGTRVVVCELTDEEGETCLLYYIGLLHSEWLDLEYRSTEEWMAWATEQLMDC